MNSQNIIKFIIMYDQMLEQSWKLGILNKLRTYKEVSPYLLKRGKEMA